MIARPVAEAIARWLALDNPGHSFRHSAHHSLRREALPGERSERDRAWDRLAGAVLYGTAHDIAAAREHLLCGPAGGLDVPDCTAELTAVLPGASAR